MLCLEEQNKESDWYERHLQIIILNKFEYLKMQLVFVLLLFEWQLEW